jgi:hypothetical protein
MELENEIDLDNEIELDNEIDLDNEIELQNINKLDQFNRRIEFLLDEFIKSYVMVRMNPNNDDVQQRYENVTSNITKLQGNLFSMSNNIKIKINNINEKLLKLDVLIKEERDKNKKLRKQLGMLEDQNISASEMITDYGKIYDRNYLRNWGLFISTIICIYTIRSMYSNPIV